VSLLALVRSSRRRPRIRLVFCVFLEGLKRSIWPDKAHGKNRSVALRLTV